MQTNRKTAIRTHEGAKAKQITPGLQLRRSLLSCLLFESGFYEDGQSIADRILSTAKQCSTELVSALCREARDANLRHAPLWLAQELLTRHGSIVSKTITNIIRRPDEITEILSMYWMNGRKPMSNQLRSGLANAFYKFDEYQFAKHNSKKAVKLRDAIRLAHPKPRNQDESGLFKRITNQELKTPDTWETRLCGGEDKKDVFEDLLNRGELGYMALLRNLRGMREAGVDNKLIKKALINRKGVEKILPYRFIAAAKYAPNLEHELDIAMGLSMEGHAQLKGKTILLVDVSGSMDWPMSGKSEMNRIDAACGLAILTSYLCEDLEIFTFSNRIVEVPSRRSLALIDAVKSSQPNMGTWLGKAVSQVNNMSHDRLIVITDEQSHDPVPDPVSKQAYMINVASSKNGVGYGPWKHIDGFSEQAVKWIQEFESTGIY